MSDLLIHLVWDHHRHGRLTARMALVSFVDRVVKYKGRKIGYVTKAQPVDAGRAVRLTVRKTSSIEVTDQSKLVLGNLRDE